MTKNALDSGLSRDEEIKAHRSCSSLRIVCEAMLRVMKNKVAEMGCEGI